MIDIYVVFCENCKTNEKYLETAFKSEEDAIDYVNRKSNEYRYIEWYYDYEVVGPRDVTDNNIRKKED